MKRSDEMTLADRVQSQRDALVLIRSGKTEDAAAQDLILKDYLQDEDALGVLLGSLCGIAFSLAVRVAELIEVDVDEFLGAMALQMADVEGALRESEP